MPQWVTDKSKKIGIVYKEQAKEAEVILTDEQRVNITEIIRSIKQQNGTIAAAEK